MITFDKIGATNTDTVVSAALDYAKRHDIEKIVVASVTGTTACKLKGCGKKVVVVTHQNGFLHPGEQEFPEGLRDELGQCGMSFLTTTHFFAGADRALNRKFGGIYPAELLAHTLRILGQGFKVCVEVSVMAKDAGYIDAGEDVIAIAGTGRGADTAIVIHPEYSHNFFATDVQEIICMPRGHTKQ